MKARVVSCCVLLAASVLLLRADPALGQENLGSTTLKDFALDAYQKKFQNVLGVNWYRLMSVYSSQIPNGSVQVSFVITAEGAVVDIKDVTDKEHQNPKLLKFCLQALRETKAPPIPESLPSQLKDRRLRYDSFTFTKTERSDVKQKTAR